MGGCQIWTDPRIKQSLIAHIPVDPRTWRADPNPQLMLAHKPVLLACGCGEMSDGERRMQLVGAKVLLSASDLIGFLNCRHLTQLDFDVAHGKRTRPIRADPFLEALAERGRLHEEAYVSHLRGQGRKITEIGGKGFDAAAAQDTIAAMKAGADVVVQAAFLQEGWGGRADILLRVEKPSNLGSWSYEVADTKLAQETKGGTILQLCLYSDLVGRIQGRTPENAHVITPETEFEPQSYRIADFSAYYRRVKRLLEKTVDVEKPASTYPEPNPHCDVCRWSVACDRKRRADDHLSLVAGISRGQTRELQRREVPTTRGLASLKLPLSWKPDRGSVQSYVKIHHQARIQVAGRDVGHILYEDLPVEPGLGLALLPEPSEGDVFFDLEGDPFVPGGGREFLFGYAFGRAADELRYEGQWCLTAEEEKKAYDSFINFVVERRRQYPDMHVYHFAPYEPAALKRLMGRYASKSEELDQLLRNLVFVDLYAVVRNAIRASVESYSIKKLEPLYGFERTAALPEVGPTMARLQACLELGDLNSILSTDKDLVTAYNRDDCLSTAYLRNWLEGRRQALIARGQDIQRPLVQEQEASDKLKAWEARVLQLVQQLTADVPVDEAQRSPEQHARWLLAYSLDWKRREDKAAWWEFFRLRDLSIEDLLEEGAAVAGLEFAGVVEMARTRVTERYTFPPQETQVRSGDKVYGRDGVEIGEVTAVSLEDGSICIKKTGKAAKIRPEFVFASRIIQGDPRVDARVRLAEHVCKAGLIADDAWRPARDLLLRRPPRTRDTELVRRGESTVDAAVRIITNLDQGILPIQGPPGAGKTYTGARMICALIRAGKRVGITANSHKVIRNLLDEVTRAAREQGINVSCVQKPERGNEEEDTAFLKLLKTNEALDDAIQQAAPVAGATGFYWARPEAAEIVDVLFVDEAAQMSLADVLAVSQAAKVLVLLGDPRQLDQPMQGSHPVGVDVSAFDHLLSGRSTIGPEQGLFLAETWRLHPDICAFTSEIFYDGRLKSKSGLERQLIKSNGKLRGSGLLYVAVPHEGNQNASVEEAEMICGLILDLLSSNPTWIDREGREQDLGLGDILVIAPYNAQVFELQARLPGARIGTVDKFQGQEAPLVFYSMTSSSKEDAPRGMEFLYSSNRLNVATSRAKALCVLVGAPMIFEAECRTPAQIGLANAFCRYLEICNGSSA